MSSLAATASLTANSGHWPTELIRSVLLADGRSLTLRPILPQDAHLLQGFVQALCARTRRLRFHAGVRQLGRTMLERFTCVDFERQMALVASVTDAEGFERIVADARYCPDADGLGGAEIGICIADEFQGLGLGRAMVQALDAAAQRAGLHSLHAEVLDDNDAMLSLLRSLGWRVCGCSLLNRSISLQRAVGMAQPLRREPTLRTWAKLVRRTAAWMLQISEPGLATPLRPQRVGAAAKVAVKAG
jgi:RimJ/RimL family protein N-acetyltransferase